MAIGLRVAEAWDAAEAIRGLTLVSAEDAPLPAVEPGAHIDIHLPEGGTRAYSLIDWDGGAAAPEAWHLGVRLEPEGDGGSRYMHALKPGDTLTVDGPANDFPLAADEAPALLIAGGIGITPMIAMAGALKARGTPYRLHYAVRDAAAAAFADRLAEAHGDALALHHDDRAGGVLDVAALVAEASRDTHLYICGPRPMIDATRAAAEAAGHPADRVHVELFEAAAAGEGDAPFEVELASSGAVYTIPPGRTIIEVLEEAGEDLIYDCQRGDCGICQTAVLEGVPDHRDVVLSDAERAGGEVMQICVSRARTPRLKLDL